MAEEQIITLTDKAISHIGRIIADQPEAKGLRIGVIGGGCSGLSYKIDFGEEKANDRILNFDTFNVFVDPKSSIYLKGVTLDYQDGLNGKGFVFKNPNASNTCGCGESFSI